MSTKDERKYASLLPLLTKKGPFSGDTMEPGVEMLDHLAEQKILVIGAGGLGCEILKNLALSGFKDIHVIDLDTIDVSNLNRQFLFRKADVGKPKSQVAADFINRRCKGVTVQSYQGKIQDNPPEWYKSFDLVIAGLDNIEARRWINKTLVDFVKYNPDGSVDWDTVKPLVDGGTEGFSGQSRMILPGYTSCFECSVKSLPPERVHFHMCTIANVPRIPEHCVMFALQIQWPLLTSFKSVTEYNMLEARDEKNHHQPSVTLDKDDVNHMTWIFNRAEERAKKFGITGVTYNLTMQFVKNIIPAIASTNALIAAECVNEIFKYLTFCAPRLDNFFLFMGAVGTGINSETYKYNRVADCDVCKPPQVLQIKQADTIESIFEQLTKKLGFTGIKAASAGDKLLYLKNKHEDYVDNLKYPPMFQGIDDGSTWVFSDATKGTEKVIIRWTEPESQPMEEQEEEEDSEMTNKD